VTLDDFSLASLEDASIAGQTTPGVLLVRALRYYLAERERDRPGWPCSRLFQEDGAAEAAATVELDLDGATWEAFSLEAVRQGVSTDQLLRHATLYYLADQDSGRITEKILVDLEKTDP
jgi:hypothetical protein